MSWAAPGLLVAATGEVALGAMRSVLRSPRSRTDALQPVSVS